MRKVGVSEAKTQLSRLLGQVARGERIVITRHGEPVAQLARWAPAGPSSNRRKAVEQLKDLRKRYTLRSSVRELIDEGRR